MLESQMCYGVFDARFRVLTDADAMLSEELNNTQED